MCGPLACWAEKSRPILVFILSFMDFYFYSFIFIFLFKSLIFCCLGTLLGLVPSGVLLALMQWGGRTHFLLAIVRQIAEVQNLLRVLTISTVFHFISLLDHIVLWLRIHMLYLQVQELPSVCITFTAWSISEVKLHS